MVCAFRLGSARASWLGPANRSRGLPTSGTRLPMAAPRSQRTTAAGFTFRTANSIVYFTTKGDNRVWAYDTNASTIHVLYDDDFFSGAELTGVDHVVVSAGGDILVAEDGGNMQIVAHTPAGVLVPLVQIVGHNLSEVTGPAFDPSGNRLYFSSQRGDSGNFIPGGVTYEVSGPFVV